MTLTRIGRYEIEKELGHGAMAVVYKAIDPLIGRVVAIKTIRLESSISLEKDELRQRLYREAQSAGKLNHPNIVTIYDIGEEGDLSYIAMEFIEGETLELWKSRQIIPPLEQTIAIMEQIASGLDFAAARGVIHRDIKPGNIMLTQDLKVKIADFGIAKLSTSKFTQTGMVMGTPSYMSPEQAMGKELDGRSDLFSLGIILYEMLTGEKPFVGTNPSTIIYKILHEEPVPPRKLNVTLHPGFDYVVGKMLSKSPEQRYQTCQELLADVRNYRSLGVSTEAETLKVQAVAGPRRSPLIPFLVFLLVAAMGGFGYIYYRQLRRETPSSVISELSKSPEITPKPLPKTAEREQKQPEKAIKTEPPPEVKPSAAGETKMQEPQRKIPEPPAKPVFARVRFATEGTEFPVTLFDGGQKLKDGLSESSTIQISAGEHSFRVINTANFLDLRKEGVRLEPNQPFTITLPGLASAYIEISPNDAYDGCTILLNGMHVPTPYPAQIPKLAAGNLNLTFRWGAGKYAGKEISAGVTLQANHHYLITGNPTSEKPIIQMAR